MNYRQTQGAVGVETMPGYVKLSDEVAGPAQEHVGNDSHRWRGGGGSLGGVSCTPAQDKGTPEHQQGESVPAMAAESPVAPPRYGSVLPLARFISSKRFVITSSQPPERSHLRRHHHHRHRQIAKRKRLRLDIYIYIVSQLRR